MTLSRLIVTTITCALLLASASIAETPPKNGADQKATSAAPASGACAALIGGSGNVTVEGRQAGTVGALGCLKPLEGSANVTVNDRPVLRVGDRVQCPDGRVGVITGGAASVMVNGRPAATAASRVVGCE